MKALYILRHGKSRDAVEGASDHDRPLTGDGREAGAKIARTLGRRGWHPQQVLCSTARRARETWEALASAWAAGGADPVPPPVFLDGLYLAPPQSILDELAALPDDVASVLVIGHNPGLHKLATALSRHGQAKLREKLDTDFPTCALAVIAVSSQTWVELEPSCARLEDLIFPDELE